MKTNIKNKLATGLMGALAVVTMATATVMVPNVADAVTCPPGSKNAGASLDNYALCNMDETQLDQKGNGIWTTINTIINVLLGVIGIVAVIMIIYGGFKLVTSEGSADKVKSGKETILYGVVGLVVALLAFAIVNFVIASFFGSPNSGTSSSSGGGTTVNSGNAQSTPSSTTGRPSGS
ncbi:hypothetical protein IJI55_00675 [Candidatus Saccharibacteria bacterium]|nr:hypothetical protein [Candidatus Saccharibacteria bacterium]